MHLSPLRRDCCMSPERYHGQAIESIAILALRLTRHATPSLLSIPPPRPAHRQSIPQQATKHQPHHPRDGGKKARRSVSVPIRMAKAAAATALKSTQSINRPTPVSPPTHSDRAQPAALADAHGGRTEEGREPPSPSPCPRPRRPHARPSPTPRRRRPRRLRRWAAPRPCGWRRRRRRP